MNPIILSDNCLDTDNLGATDTASGYDIKNIIDLRTYTFWTAASAGTKYITTDCGSAKEVDCLAIIGHNFNTAAATISIESSPDNSIWTERLAGFVPTSDKAFLKPLSSYSARYWRIKIVTASIIPKIAIAILGKRLNFPYPPDAPYIPYSESVEVESKRSKKGHILGTIIKYKPISISANFSNLTRDFVLNSFKPFWDSYASEMKPFFWAWDIDNFPENVFFVKMKDNMDFKFPLTTLNYVDSISLEMEGIKEI